MQIILANFSMKTWTGSELFVRDLALALQARGHSIVVFSPVLGALAHDLSMRCIACVSDLSMVAEAPDVIIGNSRDETVMCLAHFPQVPAISVCHDRTAFQGMPPKFQRIHQYVAVDENCAERLVFQHGIERSRVEMIFNGVDLQRFQPRAQLPSRPSRALYFSNYANDAAPGTQAIASACHAMGVTLELAGLTANKEERFAERRLPQYDLVFAKARCAMEALAVGCAVIVLNEVSGINGMAGMVTPANMEHWRRWNFGRRLMQIPTTVESVKRAIADYDKDNALQCQAWAREHLSLECTVNAFEALAQRVVRDHRELPRIDPEIEWREFTHHFTEHFLAPTDQQTASQLGEALAVNQDLQKAVMTQEQCNAALRDQSQALERQLNEQLHSMRSRLEDAHRRFSIVQEEARNASLHSTALESSLSWRLTRPLRWFGNLLGKPWNGT
ncbi:glycosyltransferase family 4 protein [Diaphorobacter sp. HDW4B]|uniref:glycosyltransferase n=1 Tax=Diaphorobacter sp. HDW4B TaxID=2714925 RepID=UPI00140AE695|nr:glycosyltransferase [Diaphorobacter sp. HDW4B]QIL69777.1 glycosyltransferase family 4 protein [Diaphorobacter sp. HDW4B]